MIAGNLSCFFRAPRSVPILNSCTSKNTSERKDYIMENLVVTVEE